MSKNWIELTETDGIQMRKISQDSLHNVIFWRTPRNEDNCIATSSDVAERSSSQLRKAKLHNMSQKLQKKYPRDRNLL